MFNPPVLLMPYAELPSFAANVIAAGYASKLTAPFSEVIALNVTTLSQSGLYDGLGLTPLLAKLWLSFANPLLELLML